MQTHLNSIKVTTTQLVSCITILEEVPEPRLRAIVEHDLPDILIITRCTILRGGESCYDLEAFEKVRLIASAWATESGLLLGQRKVKNNSSEITALPELLRALELAGCMVTADALHCQKNLAQELLEAEANYVRAVVQRCRVHKRRNALDHLPQDKRAQAAWRLRMTWAQPTAQAALKALRAWVKWLDTISPSAARSLEEGLEETLTLHQLGLNEPLRRSLCSTNLIESCFARTTGWTRRVKRWREVRRLMRWGAAAWRVACLRASHKQAEQGFRRIQGYQHLADLIVAVKQHHKSLQNHAARLKQAAS